MIKGIKKYWLAIVVCIVLFSVFAISRNLNNYHPQTESSLSLNSSIQTPEPTESPRPTIIPTPAPIYSIAPTIAPILLEDNTNYQTVIEEPSDEVLTVEDEDISYTVYITETGEKYHSFGCQYLKKSCIEIDFEDAIDRGYTPCSKCDP